MLINVYENVRHILLILLFGDVVRVFRICAGFQDMRNNLCISYSAWNRSNRLLVFFNTRLKHRNTPYQRLVSRVTVAGFERPSPTSGAASAANPRAVASSAKSVSAPCRVT